MATAKPTSAEATATKSSERNGVEEGPPSGAAQGSTPRHPSSGVGPPTPPASTRVPTDQDPTPSPRSQPTPTPGSQSSHPTGRRQQEMEGSQATSAAEFHLSRHQHNQDNPPGGPPRPRNPSQPGPARMEVGRGQPPAAVGRREEEDNLELMACLGISVPKVTRTSRQPPSYPFFPGETHLTALLILNWFPNSIPVCIFARDMVQQILSRILGG